LNALDGVSKNMKDCCTICTKSLELHTRTNKNLKKCNALDDVFKNTKDCLTISSKPQDPCARTNKRYETLLQRNKRRLSQTT